MEIVENTQATDVVAEDTMAEVEQAIDNLPQRRLAKQVQAELAEAGVDEAVQSAETKAEPEQAEFAAEKARIAKALKDRGKVFQERQQAKAEAEQIKAEAQRMKAEAEAAMSEARKAAEWVRQLRSNPQEALKLAGVNPEDFILDVAKEGTEEGRMLRKMREYEAKIAEFDNWKKEIAEREERTREDEARQRAMTHRQQVVGDFLTKAASEKYPNIKSGLEHGLFSKISLVAEGDSIADMYREATGQSPAIEDILEYIDAQVGEGYRKITGTQSKAREPVASGAKAPQGGKARTLSVDDASERRALRADVGSLDGDDRMEAARAAVRAVLKRQPAE